MIPIDALSMVRRGLEGEFEVLKEGSFRDAGFLVLKKGGRRSIKYVIWQPDGGGVNIRWYRRILKSRIPSHLIVVSPEGVYEIDKNYLRRQAARKENRVKNEDGTITLMFPLTEKQRWKK